MIALNITGYMLIWPPHPHIFMPGTFYLLIILLIRLTTQLCTSTSTCQSEFIAHLWTNIFEKQRNEILDIQILNIKKVGEYLSIFDFL